MSGINNVAAPASTAVISGRVPRSRNAPQTAITDPASTAWNSISTASPNAAPAIAAHRTARSSPPRHNAQTAMTNRSATGACPNSVVDHPQIGVPSANAMLANNAPLALPLVRRARS